MGIGRIVPAVLFAAVLAGTAHGTEKVAVMNLKAQEGVDAFLPPLINELFCAKIPEYGGYEVVTGPFIQEKIDASGNEELMTCNAADCYYLIGSGFEAQLLVAGTIGMRDGAYLTNLVLLDVYNERVTRNLARRYDGDQFGIVDELEKYLRELFGVDPAGLNVDIPEDMLMAAGGAPAPAYDAPDDDYEDDDGYGDDDGYDDEEPDIAAAADDDAASVPAGPSAMFRWCDDTDREVIAGAGYSLVDLGDFSAYDLIKIGYRNKRNVFILQVKMNETEGSGLVGIDRLDTTTTITGGGILYGYRLCQLFNGWATITPGASAGFYKYVQDIDVYYNSTGPWVLDEGNSVENETVAFFGAGLQLDIGTMAAERLGVYGYTHAQLLWVKDAIFFLDFGLRIGYRLP